ncbi:Hypp5747 [Branchiostoma lanceolatum]|uniref:Hypp5747 protein n=1 Tax=Branchiostoma lanceolatum TaxID=7740 RepID=A0A8J9VGY3_BRALA|nr:Hypp5747 [Branchiostoma lanceolatum]
MERVAEQEFVEEQISFRKRVGTRDQIFNLRVLMEKPRENNVQLFMAFIDYKKAFDSVRHQTLWTVMETMGVSRHMVQLLRNLYRDQQAAVRVEEDLTEWFGVKKGVGQGCLLSPMCFNFYSEAVMRESVEEQPTIGVIVSGRNINNLRFADDIALIATSPEGLQKLLDSTDSTSSEYQLEISTKKTKVMAVAKEPTQVTAICRGEQLQQVPRFKYLGSTMEQTASCTRSRVYPKDEWTVHSTAILILGVVADRLKETDTERAKSLVGKLEESLGIHDPWHHRHLRSTLTANELDKHYNHKATLLESLGNAEFDSSFDHLLSYVNNTDSPPLLRRSALSAIRKYDHHEAASLLLDSALFDEEEHVRYHAAVQYQRHPKALNLLKIKQSMANG